VATSKDNVQLMIEAFTDFREGDDHSPEATDDLLRILLDNSKVPSTQTPEWDDPDAKTSTFTDEEREEITEMRKLLCGHIAPFGRLKAGETVLWESREDLMTLLITYPPVILEQLLITGMVIYLMRCDNMNFDAETDTFNEFYAGWGSVVCESID
jgi:hypothetical protein